MMGQPLGWITEPVKQIPVIAEPDVLVVGGGSAGIAAAVAAARSGADTMLVERYGYLGGMATGGLVILLLTMDDGAGRQMVAGLCQELVERLTQRGAAYYPPKEHWGLQDEALVEHYRRWGLVWGRGPHVVRYSVAFDPEEFKVVADSWLVESRVRNRFHTWAVGVVLEDGLVRAVIVESKAGRQAIRPRVVIDATGDGDLFALAGAAYEKVEVHPWLWFRMGNVRQPDSAIEAGKGHFFPTLGGFFMKTIGDGRTLMPWGAADVAGRKVDATSPDDLTYAEIECRQLVMKEVQRLKASVPGFERAYLADVADQLGITESRRLIGEYVLTREDEQAHFPDSVGITGNWTKSGATYEIPYRSMLPRGLKNLLVAGRCISVDHRTQHTTKEIPPCMLTGQAAGTAAEMAVHNGGDVHAVNIPALQRRLREHGAIIPDG